MNTEKSFFCYMKYKYIHISVGNVQQVNSVIYIYLDLFSLQLKRNSNNRIVMKGMIKTPNIHQMLFSHYFALCSTLIQ